MANTLNEKYKIAQRDIKAILFDITSNEEARLLRDMDIASTDLYNYLMKKYYNITLPGELSSNIKII